MSLSPQRLELWNDIVRLTESMARHIQAAEWAEAAEADRSRLDVLERFNQAPILPDEADEVAARLKALLSAQERLLGASQAAREELLEKIRELGAGRKAQSAYATPVPRS